MLLKFIEKIKVFFETLESKLDEPTVLDDLDSSSMSPEIYDIYKLATEDDEQSIFSLGLRYFHGNGVEKNYAHSYKIFRLLEDINADAEYYMGEIWRLGDEDGDPDYEQACIHYSLALNCGNYQALSRLQDVAEKLNDEHWLEFIERYKEKL